jgi:hypothetical protein
MSGDGSFLDKYFSKGDHWNCWLFCQFIIQVLVVKYKPVMIND